MRGMRGIDKSTQTTNNKTFSLYFYPFRQLLVFISTVVCFSVSYNGLFPIFTVVWRWITYNWNIWTVVSHNRYSILLSCLMRIIQQLHFHVDRLCCPSFTHTSITKETAAQIDWYHKTLHFSFHIYHSSFHKQHYSWIINWKQATS